MRMMLLAFLMVLPLLAMAQAPGPPIKRTNPPALSTPTGYTHVVEVSGPAKTIYIAGQVAFDASGKVIGAGDMKAQSEQVFKNLEAALKAAGATFADVVKMNTYVTDMSQLAAVREVRSRYFGTHDSRQHARAGQRPRSTRTADRDRSHRRVRRKIAPLFRGSAVRGLTCPRTRSASP